MVRLLTTQAELQEYDTWLRHAPAGNFWQSLERKEYVESIGKETRLYGLKEKGQLTVTALVVIDRTSFGLATWEIARGPVGKWGSGEVGRGSGEMGKWGNGEVGKWGSGEVGNGVARLMETIIEDAKSAGCMALYLSPAHPLPSLVQRSTSQKNEGETPFPLLPSARHVHCEATRIIDLTVPEEEIMRQMKPKGRYNIHVAAKHGVHAEESDDIDRFIELVGSTARRDGFEALPPKRYKAFYQNLEESFLLMTYHPDKPSVAIGGLLGILWNGQGIYYYGASDHAYRALMAPYRLQWRAIRTCKAKGAKTYDLLGVAPLGADLKHPWHGISAFKEKFGGTVVMYPKEQMLVMRPWAYRCLQVKRAVWRGVV